MTSSWKFLSEQEASLFTFFYCLIFLKTEQIPSFCSFVLSDRQTDRQTDRLIKAQFLSSAPQLIEVTFFYFFSDRTQNRGSFEKRKTQKTKCWRFYFRTKKARKFKRSRFFCHCCQSVKGKGSTAYFFGRWPLSRN